jgi:hypothetical protein
MKAIPFIAGAALLVGTLDIATAFADYYIQTGKGPDGVLRYIAGSLFGPSAFTGGSEMIVYGLLLHYLIALIFTIIFYLIYPKIPLMAQHPVAAAVLYGIFIWLVMTFIVVPSTKIKTGPFDWLRAVKAIIILVLMIGVPLSLLARKRFSKTSS